MLLFTCTDSVVHFLFADVTVNKHGCRMTGFGYISSGIITAWAELKAAKVSAHLCFDS